MSGRESSSLMRTHLALMAGVVRALLVVDLCGFSALWAGAADAPSGPLLGLTSGDGGLGIDRFAEPGTPPLSAADRERLLRNLGVLGMSGRSGGSSEIVPPEHAVLPEAEAADTPAPPPALSRLEQMISGTAPEEISRDLRQYGYEFFARSTPTFAPVMDVPVGSDYVIGPGDSFKVHIWGKVETTHDLTVNRDGQVAVPRVGVVSVGGLTLGEMKRHLAQKFKVFYPEFEMAITMGHLRAIQVFVVGEAARPGTYSVSSLSTVVTALFGAGGPNKNGSMRNIKLMRDGATVQTIDLYEFFMRGQKKQDVRVRSGDTIFIPLIGKVAGVAGNVKRPAIYETRDGDTWGDLLAAAGGVLPVGHRQNVAVERVEGNSRRIVKSFDLHSDGADGNDGLRSAAEDGDLVKVFSVHGVPRGVVHLEGHVKYPREYEFRLGMRARDLVPSHDSLLPEPYLPQATIRRLAPPDMHPEVVSFHLGKMLAGEKEENPTLQDQDRVVIHCRWDKESMPEVVIRGHVRDPGVFPMHEGMRVKDLIFVAGNLTSKAWRERATLARVVDGVGGRDLEDTDFSPARAMAGLDSDNLTLRPDDVIYIRAIPKYTAALQRRAHLEGEFCFPGEYTFSEGERLSSVIRRAGGYTTEAFPFGAVFLRESVRAVQSERLKEYVDQLEEDIMALHIQASESSLGAEEAAIFARTLNARKTLLAKMKAARPTGRMVINLARFSTLRGRTHDFELRPGDRLIVPKRPDFVNVVGEVHNQTALLAHRDATLGSVLKSIGGVTRNADEDNVYVVKANGEVVTKANHGRAMRRYESLPLGPGDTIIVPRRFETYGGLRLTRDMTEILFRIAMAAGVVIAAF